MHDSRKTDCLRSPAVLDSLGKLQSFAKGKAQEFGLPAEYDGKLDLVLEELVVNVIHYAYPNDQGNIEISCLLQKKQHHHSFCVTLQDWGAPFNPLERARPNSDLPLEDRPIGGLGIFLAEEMADSISYKRVRNSNVLIFCFDLPHRSSHRTGAV